MIDSPYLNHAFIDDIVGSIQRCQLSDDEIAFSLMYFIELTMRTQNATGHNLADEDGVCVLSITRYE